MHSFMGFACRRASVSSRVSSLGISGPFTFFFPAAALPGVMALPGALRHSTRAAVSTRVSGVVGIGRVGSLSTLPSATNMIWGFRASVLNPYIYMNALV